MVPDRLFELTQMRPCPEDANDSFDVVIYSYLVAGMLLELTKMGPCPEDANDSFDVVIDGEDKELRCR